MEQKLLLLLQEWQQPFQVWWLVKQFYQLLVFQLQEVI